MSTTSIKVQLEFRMNAEGWSEIYYLPGTEPKSLYADAQALVVERKKFLVSVATIHHVRLSAAQPGGAAFRYAVTNGSGGLSSTLRRDVRNTTVTVQAWGTPKGQRVFKFHGYPDDGKLFYATGEPQNALPLNVNAFMEYLTTGGFQIKTVTKAFNDDTNPKVTDITVGNDGGVTFAGTFPGVAVGDKIRIGSVRGYKTDQFNGIWTVSEIVAGPPAGIKAYSTRYIDPQFMYQKSSGRFRSAKPSDYTFTDINEYSATCGFSTRKVGRPTDSPVGRR